jgi:hypothetical protein
MKGECMVRIIIELCTLVVLIFLFFGLILPIGYNSRIDAIVIISQISTIIILGYFVYCIYRIIKLIFYLYELYPG